MKTRWPDKCDRDERVCTWRGTLFFLLRQDRDSYGDWDRTVLTAVRYLYFNLGLRDLPK